MEDWNLTAKTIMSASRLENFFDSVGYSGLFLVHSMTQNMRLKLFDCMQTIRSVEEEIARRYSEAGCGVPRISRLGRNQFLSIFSLLVKQNDYAVSTHRGHAHYLAKGGNLNAMIAELFGKVTGCSGGKGGSASS